MLSVVIPTKDSEEALARTLATLVPAAADGTVREVIVADGGSTDDTARIAEGTGCHFVSTGPDLEARLSDGAAAASRGEFLMFIPPGVQLEGGWEADLAALIERMERNGRARNVAVFRFAVDDVGLAAALRQSVTRLGIWLTGVPHLDQGLIIRRSLFREVGGFRPVGALCLVDLLRRVGRLHVACLRSTASRIADDGHFGRWLPGLGRLRSSAILGLMALRLPVSVVGRLGR